MTETSNRPGPGPVVFSWCGSGGVCADADLSFYVDEAGNTGINHLDAAQPYYVTGGWLFRSTDASRVRHLVGEACAATSMRELKGSQMLKTTAGTRAAHALVLRLLSFATPISIIIEKNFALRIRLADDFIHYPGGPFFGDKLPERDVGRGFVEALSVLSSSELNLANQYIKQPSPKSARECASVLHTALLGTSHAELARAVRDSCMAPERWWQPDEIRRRSLSPNVLGFNTLLQTLELLGLECGQKVSIIHDELPNLQEVYEFYQDYAANRDLVYHQMFEKAGCPGRIRHVSRPTFSSSASEPAIQAADVLCGAINSLLASLANCNHDVPHERRELAIILLWAFVEPDLRRYSKFVGSDAIGMRYGQQLVDLFGKDGR